MRKLLFLFLMLPAFSFGQDITITIPDAVAPRVVNDFCLRFGYQDIIPDPNNPKQTIPNPVSKVQFVKNYLVSYIKGVVVDQEANLAAIQARQNTINQGNSDITITAP